MLQYLIKTSSVYGRSTSYHYPHSSREAEMQESVVIFMHRSKLFCRREERRTDQLVRRRVRSLIPYVDVRDDTFFLEQYYKLLS